MNIGGKIKYYRNKKGISQETLGQIAGINSATIKKYEYGLRNPKPDQLQKIAEALGVSVSTFLDLEIKTASDVLTLLMKMYDATDMTIEGVDDEIGMKDPNSIRIKFNNDEINSLLSKLEHIKDRQQAIEDERNKTGGLDDEDLKELADTFADSEMNLLMNDTDVRKRYFNITEGSYATR